MHNEIQFALGESPAIMVERVRVGGYDCPVITESRHAHRLHDVDAGVTPRDLRCGVTCMVHEACQARARPGAVPSA